MEEFSIKFRSLKFLDLEWARNLRNDFDTRHWLGSCSKINRLQQIKWFLKLKRNKSKQRLVVLLNEKKAGIVRIDSIDKENNSLCLGLDLHPNFRGKGYAKKIYQSLLSSFFNKGYNRIWLFVISYNERAYSLYKKLGFKDEGAQREAIYRDGQYYDYKMMSILKKEWL